jgi:nucleotide-binding universal stress UspA family protein
MATMMKQQAEPKVRQREEEVRLQSTRVRFKNILIATDFTTRSLKALRVGAAAARQFAAKVHLVHVTTPMNYAGDLSMESTVLDVARTRALTAMHEWGNHPLLGGLRHREEVLEGPLVHELQQYVTDKRIDLVIVGTAGRKGMEKLFMGSAAETIVRHLTCPVLIVGPRVGAAPIQYRSIVFATSLHANSLRAAQYAVALAEEMDARLTLLHVDPSGDRRRFDETTRNAIYRQLRSFLPTDSECWCQPKVRFELGDPATEILASAVQDEADLIVMSSHDDPIFADHAPWSVLAKVLRDAKCPVLAVRAHYS